MSLLVTVDPRYPFFPTKFQNYKFSKLALGFVDFVCKHVGLCSDRCYVEESMHIHSLISHACLQIICPSTILHYATHIFRYSFITIAQNYPDISTLGVNCVAENGTRISSNLKKKNVNSINHILLTDRCMMINFHSIKSQCRVCATMDTFC